jgi:hypothetical protein
MMFSYHRNGIEEDILDKSELVVGQTYKGRCRNATEAVWTGKGFEYTRHKFGDSYKETIEHPEDDRGSDVFMPLRSLNGEKHA